MCVMLKFVCFCIYIQTLNTSVPSSLLPFCSKEPYSLIQIIVLASKLLCFPQLCYPKVYSQHINFCDPFKMQIRLLLFSAQNPLLAPHFIHSTNRLTTLTSLPFFPIIFFFLLILLQTHWLLLLLQNARYVLPQDIFTCFSFIPDFFPNTHMATFEASPVFTEITLFQRRLPHILIKNARPPLCQHYPVSLVPFYFFLHLTYQLLTC